MRSESNRLNAAMPARLLCFLYMIILAAAPRLAAAECKVNKPAELPVTMAGLRPLLAGKINGADATFLLDSGAFYSMISRAAASQYHLELHSAPRGLWVEGIGGSVQVFETHIENLQLQAWKFTDARFLVGGPSPGAVGLIGQELFEMDDVEYDLSRGILRAMLTFGECKDTFLAGWVKPGEPYSVIEIEPRIERQGQSTIAPAYLNGKKIRVMFDTGSPTSFVSRPAAQRAGFDPSAAAVKQAGMTHGLGRRSYQTWVAPFDIFQIGGEKIHHALLRVGDTDDLDCDMLLGADFFLSHHIYVSHKWKKLYFTYNGGPVFDLTRAAETAAAPDEGEKAAPDAEEPADAPGLARRGLASASRGDLQHAVEDLTRAIKLDPTQAAYLEHRALLYARQQKIDAALADMDQALVLKPESTEALVIRAQLRLRARNPQGAVSDADAADRLATRQADVRLRIGEVYLRAEAPAQALSQFDQWIENHPEDTLVPSAKSGRCWARALLGTDLDKALSDCDVAVRKVDKSAAPLVARGFVLLRLGRYNRSIEDFDASLELEPGDAWALYGRGIDRLRKGMNTEGQSDIAAAAKLLPAIAEQAAKHGITP